MLLIIGERIKNGNEEVQVIWKNSDPYQWVLLTAEIKRSDFYEDFKKRKKEEKGSKKRKRNN